MVGLEVPELEVMVMVGSLAEDSRVEHSIIGGYHE